MARRSPTTGPWRSRRIRRSYGSTSERIMLQIRNLAAGYGQLKVLRRVTMHVSAGEIVTIIGTNGAGKSTLLKTLSGLIRATDGQILFDKRNIMGMTTEEIVYLGCSLVPEGRQVFAPMTVRENLFLGAYPQYRRKAGGTVHEEMERVFSLFP